MPLLHLRDIGEHRATVVLDHFGEDKLAHLVEDIRLAVQCRNYYTHGPGDAKTDDAIDFSNYDVVGFLTETLEFIYGMSELLLCGWDSDTSVADAWHPLWGGPQVLRLQSRDPAASRFALSHSS